METGEGVLDVKELQLVGKKRMDTASFLRGFQMEDGSFCGYASRVMPRAVLKNPAEKPAAGTTETRSKGEMFYVRNVWLRLWLWS